MRILTAPLRLDDLSKDIVLDGMARGTAFVQKREFSENTELSKS
jgi:hypothetical protein